MSTSFMDSTDRASGETTATMNAGAETFAGPLFLVGMPRSGTKLLRDMLNKNHRIRFSAIETEFFPFWVRQWHEFPGIESREGFSRFYRRCAHLPFFIENQERGIEVGCEEWFLACKSFTPSAVFEALMRCILSIAPEDTETIWGDKSPSYINQVPLLIQQFPEAKIIHIIRDVRDCSLSAHKAWGKSLLRAAQRWQDDVSKCRGDGLQVPDAYMEVRYEDLLTQPHVTLSSICSFIRVSADEQMLTAGTETENIGDAKGMSTLLEGNVGKYRTRLSRRIVARMEMIACTTLRSLGYPCAYAGPPVPLPKWRRRILQMADGLNLLRATADERGLVGAMRFHLTYFRISGNRVR